MTWIVLYLFLVIYAFTRYEKVMKLHEKKKKKKEVEEETWTLCWPGQSVLSWIQRSVSVSESKQCGWTGSGVVQLQFCSAIRKTPTHLSCFAGLFNDVEGIKSKITANFHASRRLCFEEERELCNPKCSRKVFGTFEKRAPVSIQLTIERNDVIAVAAKYM